MASNHHVRDSIRQIDENTWLIGTSHVLRLTQGSCDSGYLWKNNSDGSCYVLSAAPEPLPDTKSLPDDSHVRKIHEAGDESAVFKFGDALILKIRLATPGTRREHEMLAFLAEKRLNFDIPKALFYTEDAEKTYLFETYIPGKRLEDIWWDMTAEQKEFVVTQVSQVCSELRAFQSDTLTAVADHWLDPLREQRDYDVQALQEHCENLGMTCSTFVLSHNDLGPTNILVTETGNQIAILDWELAGYSPVEWIRTKFAVCGALDLDSNGKGGEATNGLDYRAWVEQRLRELGFPEVTEKYNTVKMERYEKWKAKRSALQ
ncbi:kinase-like domain-containing protein [Microdochium bolleyi]|uniref:Kinase-like domain-containing protein n=1 Tax=Microdochium bolleyi TaxID=196109 RepID=A0A136ILA7_9PEZI|nr:kinase-like domain-containing protein [Microdochium bolleyi]